MGSSGESEDGADRAAILTGSLRIGVNTAKSRTVSGLLTSVILEQGRLEGQSRDEGGDPGGSRRS
jgi:hypothetical protein